jgi:hypothetical protein
MQINIPPAIPYAVGAILILFGILRAKYLAAPRAPRLADDDQAESSLGKAEARAEIRGPEQRRHLRMGIVWILLGLFLVISTIMQMRRR